MEMMRETGARPDMMALETKGRQDPAGELETKVADSDVAAAFDEFMETFQDFREANDRRLDEIERLELERALREAGGQKAEAARALGLSRSTFYYRLQKHGLA